MIRTAQWKYFFYTNGEEFLYDIESDPLEENNLAKVAAHRALADGLKQRASAGWAQDKRGVREMAGLPAEADAATSPAKPARKKKNP
jgi:arylsulfatase A-like enzyme